MKHFLFICFCVIVVTGCKKHELPEEQSGNPYFDISAEINGEVVSLIAGEEDIYHAPTFQIDDFGIYQFESSFLHLDANANRESIKISLNDDHINVGGNSDAMELLNANAFHYNEPNTDSYYMVQFEPELFGDAISFAWNFGDGSTSTEPSPIHRYSDVSIKKYAVCLLVNYSNGCSSQLCSDITMPDAFCSGDFIAEEKTDSLTGKYWDFMAEAKSGKEPFTYSWTFEDNVNGYSNHIWYQYVMNPDDGVELACVDIADVEGCVTSICKNVLIDSVVAECATNFGYKADLIQTTDSINFNRANVIYTNTSGIEYSSANVIQPSWSRMDVSNVETYSVDFNGKSTVSSTVAFTCVLASEDGEEIVLNNGRGTISFLSGNN